MTEAGGGKGPLPRTALEPVCIALAEVIKERRQRAGLSLGQLAKKTGLSRQMLSFIENVQRIPTVDTTARIARAFRITPGRLHTEADKRLARRSSPSRHCESTRLNSGKFQ